MKKLITLSALFVFALANFSFAQISGFEQEAVAWHKQAIMTCGMFKKMESFNHDVMLQKLDNLKSGMESLQKKYADNPPDAYKNDPLWKKYFTLFLDNTRIIRERVVEKNYPLAQNYCGNYCKLFGRMHRNNGTSDLTDLMFSTRMQVMMRMEMVAAQNLDGAKSNLKPVKNLLNKYIAKTKTSAKAALHNMVAEAVQAWIKAVEQSDKSAVKTAMDMYAKAFPKAYMSTL